MVAVVDVVNRALQAIGTRTTVSAAELAAQTSNEAIQASLIIDSTRDQLSRMAPWNHCFTASAPGYLGSAPGTPENPLSGIGRWSPNQPIPPWLYMYEYPADCLRLLYLIPQPQAAPPLPGVPISPVTNVAPYSPVLGSPRFRVGSARYLTGAFGPDFNSAFAHGTVSSRVVYTNERYPLLAYVAQVTDPALMDPLFLEAWIDLLAMKLTLALTGDKALVNFHVTNVNRAIDQARTYDASEELTVIDPTPDWIRARGFNPTSPNVPSQYIDWGPMWPSV